MLCVIVLVESRAGGGVAVCTFFRADGVEEVIILNHKWKTHDGSNKVSQHQNRSISFINEREKDC